MKWYSTEKGCYSQREYVPKNEKFTEESVKVEILDQLRKDFDDDTQIEAE